MTTIIYFVEDEFFTSLEEAKKYQRRFVSAGIDTIETEKTYDEFMAVYEAARAQGNSISDSIDWARSNISKEAV